MRVHGLLVPIRKMDKVRSRMTHDQLPQDIADVIAEADLPTTKLARVLPGRAAQMTERGALRTRTVEEGTIGVDIESPVATWERRATPETSKGTLSN